MTAASYLSDQSDIFMFETNTNISAYGGGGAGVSAGRDFHVEGTNCCDKQVSGAEKGFVYDATANFTIGADDHFYIWIRNSTPGLAATTANRGVHVAIGDSKTDFVKFHVAGVDTIPLGGTFCYPVRFVNTSSTGLRTLVGSPGTTPSSIGGGINTSASVKGVNLGVDAARIGTGYDITYGTGADDPADFAGVAAADEAPAYGIFRLSRTGGFRLQGKLRIGSTSTECEFEDVGSLVACSDTPHSLSDFNEILIENDSTSVTLSAVTFQGLGTTSPGRFEMVTHNAAVTMTNCTFKDWADTILGSGATCLACNWINTDTITANDATLTGSKVSAYEGTANTSPLIWDTATDPGDYLDEMSFTKGSASTHAIEFGTASPLTMNLVGIDFDGYNSANSNTDSTLHIKRTTGNVTIYLSDCTGNISVLTNGANVDLVVNPVTLTLHVIAQEGGADISGARAHVTAGTTGPLPFEDSVIINRSGSTANVTHASHGLSDGDLVFIEGANEDEYNGVQTIANSASGSYEYTVSGTPDTPATGTITSTAVIISGTTNATGYISDTRTYASDQDYEGRVRQSSADPFYKTSPVSGIIDSSTGFSETVQMVLDQ